MFVDCVLRSIVFPKNASNNSTDTPLIFLKMTQFVPVRMFFCIRFGQTLLINRPHRLLTYLQKEMSAPVTLGLNADLVAAVQFAMRAEAERIKAEAEKIKAENEISSLLEEKVVHKHNFLKQIHSVFDTYTTVELLKMVSPAWHNVFQHTEGLPKHLSVFPSSDLIFDGLLFRSPEHGLYIRSADSCFISDTLFDNLIKMANKKIPLKFVDKGVCCDATIEVDEDFVVEIVSNSSRVQLIAESALVSYDESMSTFKGLMRRFTELFSMETVSTTFTKKKLSKAKSKSRRSSKILSGLGSFGSGSSPPAIPSFLMGTSTPPADLSDAASGPKSDTEYSDRDGSKSLDKLFDNNLFNIVVACNELGIGPCAFFSTALKVIGKQHFVQYLYTGKMTIGELHAVLSELLISKPIGVFLVLNCTDAGHEGVFIGKCRKHNTWIFSEDYGPQIHFLGSKKGKTTRLVKDDLLQKKAGLDCT